MSIEPLDEQEMVRLRLHDGGMRVHLASGGSFPARSVVYADEVSFPNIPPFAGRISSSIASATAAAEASATSLRHDTTGPAAKPYARLKTADSIDVQGSGISSGETVLVVGGGMTSAYLALHACESGCSRVILMSRHAMKKREFEVV